MLGEDALAFYDAIAPIVAAGSIDMSRVFRASRYSKGGGDDYLNAALTLHDIKRHFKGTKWEHQADKLIQKIKAAQHEEEDKHKESSPAAPDTEAPDQDGDAKGAEP